MGFQKIVIYNLIALALLVLARVLSLPFDNATPDLGNMLWFPIGAAILSYLLFGFRVFPGVLLGYLIAEVIVEGGIVDISQKELLKRTASSLAPILSIGIMRSFNLSQFFDENKIKISHVIFLILLSAIFSTLLKALLIDNELPGLDNYITTYLMGDLLGGIIFVYLGIKFLSKAVVSLVR